MSGLLGSVVDTDALLEVVWVGFGAGVGVTAAFGVSILGGTRALDLARRGRPGEAVLYGVLGLAAIAFVTAAVVFGVVVMVNKD